MYCNQGAFFSTVFGNNVNKSFESLLPYGGEPLNFSDSFLSTKDLPPQTSYK